MVINLSFVMFTSQQINGRAHPINTLSGGKQDSEGKTRREHK